MIPYPLFSLSTCFDLSLFAFLSVPLLGPWMENGKWEKLGMGSRLGLIYVLLRAHDVLVIV